MRSATLNFIAIAIALLLVLLLSNFKPAKMPKPPSTSVQASDNRELLIENARVFDGTKMLGTTSIHVRDGLIVALGKVDVPKSARRIDASGQTVLPGLIDSHVHAWDSAREDALRFGVTTMMDMFTATQQLQGARAQREARAPTNRADFYSAGTLATVQGGHGTQFGMPIPTVDSPSIAENCVSDRILEQSDYIKIVIEDLSTYRLNELWPTLAGESVRALVNAAHANELMAVVHVSKLDSAELALAAGANGLVHIFQDKIASPAFIAAASKRTFFVTPTLSVIAGMAGETPSVLNDAGLATRLTPDQQQTLGAKFNQSGLSFPKLIERARENVRLLYAAKIPILAGSDAPNPGTAHGISLHEEVAQLVRAGLPTEAALAAATSVPAKAYGLNDRGRIAVGMRADLLIVEGDPTLDITATRRIVGIYKNGSEIRAQ